MGVDKMTLETSNGAPDSTPSQNLPEVVEFYIDESLDEGNIEVDGELVDINGPDEDQDETVAEAEPDESESEGETPEDEPDSEPAADEPEDSAQEQDGPKPGTPDPYLQKLAQRQAATDAKLDQMLKLIQQQQATKPTQDKPADNDKPDSSEPDEFEEAMAELQAIAEDQDDLDEPSKADLARLAKAQQRVIRAMQKRPADAPDNSKELEELKAYVVQQKQEQEAQKGWIQFQSEHGYDGKPVWEQALEEGFKRYPDDQAKAIQRAQVIFDMKIEELDTAPPSTKKPSKPASQTKKIPPASSKTRQPALGTQTTPTGAQGAGRKKAVDSEPVCWVPDR